MLSAPCLYGQARLRLQARLGYHRGEAADDRGGDAGGLGYLAAVPVAKLPLAGGCQHLALAVADDLAGDFWMGEHGLFLLSGDRLGG